MQLPQRPQPTHGSCEKVTLEGVRTSQPGTCDPAESASRSDVCAGLPQGVGEPCEPLAAAAPAAGVWAGHGVHPAQPLTSEEATQGTPFFPCWLAAVFSLLK